MLRTFRFSSTAQRLGAPRELTFSGAQTKLGAALDGARQELAGLPLAGLVVVSDGADTTDARADGRAAGDEGGGRAGVHASALGREALDEGRPDRSRVDAARRR